MHHNHNEQNLQEGDLNIKIQLRNNPLFLKKVQSVYEVAEIMLPYDTGIELECFKGKKFNIENFEKIPDIKDVNVDDGEQRFRIPNSLEGFICLYNLCETLKENSVPEIGSGLHYHIDFTNYFDKVNQEFIDKVKEYILKELETWNYDGTYNTKSVSFNRCWCRFCADKKTIEFRIGEMSFDYKVLIKRILHCQKIVNHIKKELLIFRLNNQDKVKIIKNVPIKEIREVIKNRKTIL